MKTFAALLGPITLLALACGSSETGTTEPVAAEPAAAEPAAAEPSAAEPAAAAQPAAGLGAAPDFKLTDLAGVEHDLSQYRGKLVVLEWFNPGCPFVKYAYGEGPMKALIAEQVGKGDVVWLAINSGAQGKQGHGAEVNKTAAKDWTMKQPLLLDEAGTVGRLYGAKSTPHMFVIDAQGNLAYRGALDNAPLGKVEGGGERIDYVSSALDALRAGTPVPTAETPSYGCSVKYGQ